MLHVVPAVVDVVALQVVRLAIGADGPVATVADSGIVCCHLRRYMLLLLLM